MEWRREGSEMGWIVGDGDWREGLEMIWMVGDGDGDGDETERGFRDEKRKERRRYDGR